jgi:hypothetical protein
MTVRNADGGAWSAIAILAVLVAGTIAPAEAQWVDFTDETATRMVLQPFVDAPGGDPMLDDEEKDFATADLDQDGDADVVIVRKRPFSIPGPKQDILLMNEAGVLNDRTADLAPGFLSDLTDARDVFIGDFTGDGWQDVVIANTFGQQPKFYRNAGLDGGQNWLGLVDESALRFPTINVPADASVLQFCALWGGDVTGNGALDIYFANYNPSAATNDILFINDGSGFFTNETTQRLGSFANVAFGTSVEIHDMDDDGDRDIVKISTLYPAPPFSGGQFILFNDGSGVFDSVPFQAMQVIDPYMFTVGDLDNDGLLDQYIVSDSQDRVARALSVVQDGPINYNESVIPSQPRTSSFGGNSKLIDVDGDGFLDVGVGPIDVDIANCGFSSEFALLRNDGAGMMSDPWPGSDNQNFHVDPHDFAFLDVNSDGCPDIQMGLCTGWKVFIQTCEAAVGASVTGLNTRLGRCQNLTTGQSVNLQLQGADSWNCEAEGLVVNPGDQITQRVLGTATAAAAVGGASQGFDSRRAVCLNQTTGESINISLGASESWDCEAAGLTVSAGDRVAQVVSGSS